MDAPPDRRSPASGGYPLAIFALPLAYALVAFGFFAGMGALDRFAPFAYLAVAAPWINLLLAGLLVSEIAAAVSRDPRHPAGALVAGFGRWHWRHVLAGSASVAVFGLFLGCYTSLKTYGSSTLPFAADPLLAEIDKALHGGVDPYLLLAPLTGLPGVAVCIEVVYSAVWGMLLFVLPAVVALSPSCDAVRARFLLSLFATWIVGGNVLAMAVPSAGPAFYGAVTGDTARFAGLLDLDVAIVPREVSARFVQSALWSAHEAGVVGVGTGISAFPSMHVATAVLYVLLARAVAPVLLPAAAVFAVLILLGSISLGWHYAVDGYASVAITGLAWWATGLGTRPSTPRTASRISPAT